MWLQFFVESFTFRADSVHRAVLLNPAVYLGIPSAFHSASLLYGFNFVESFAFRIDFAHWAIPLKPGVYLGIPNLWADGSTF